MTKLMKLIALTMVALSMKSHNVAASSSGESSPGTPPRKSSKRCSGWKWSICATLTGLIFTTAAFITGNVASPGYATVPIADRAPISSAVPTNYRDHLLELKRLEAEIQAINAREAKAQAAYERATEKAARAQEKAAEVAQEHFLTKKFYENQTIYEQIVQENKESRRYGETLTKWKSMDGKEYFSKIYDAERLLPIDCKLEIDFNSLLAGEDLNLMDREAKSMENDLHEMKKYKDEMNSEMVKRKEEEFDGHLAKWRGIRNGIFDKLKTAITHCEHKLKSLIADPAGLKHLREKTAKRKQN